MKKQEVIIVDKPGKKDLVINLFTENEEVEVLALIKAEEPGDFYLRVVVNHGAAKTFGRVIVRGSASNGARIQVEGLIKIDKQANGVDDFLEMKILLLDEKSQAMAEPKLEIEANEVKASHAATVGRIDEEEIFYLMSRGMSRGDSVKLIRDGFFADVIEKVSDREKATHLREQFVG